MIYLETRPRPLKIMALISPLAAIALTLLTGGLMFAWLGFDPLKALYQFFIAPLSSAYNIAEILVKASPLALIATGLAVGYRANVWNIGAEGQLTMGALAGGAVGLAFHGVQSPLLLPAMMLAGILGGMAWAAIPALLRTRFNANELLTSLMLTYIALLFLTWCVHGPLKDPGGVGFPESKLFHQSASLSIILQGTRLHTGILATLAAALLAWIFIARSMKGFEIRVLGAAPHAASFAGFSKNGTIWTVLLASGGLAGLAGLFEVAGPVGQIVPQISPGYGFTAIIAAFLGRLHPMGILIASLLIAISYLGGEMAQITMGIPLAVTGVFQGMLLFFLLGCDVLLSHKIRIKIPRRSRA